MKTYAIVIVLTALVCVRTQTTCSRGQSMSFVRWTGVSPERAAPVFVYSASGEEDSLSGACLARCRELADCDAVAVAYDKGNCHGVAAAEDTELRAESGVSYFKKTCLELPEEGRDRWWSLEVTPGYHLHAEVGKLKTVFNITIQECYQLVLNGKGGQLHRSAQWMGTGSLNVDLVRTPDITIGNCILNSEDRYTEPESYRVSNYFTFYIENECRHDYTKKIDRCSYEEYFNQTLKHVEFTTKNHTKDECRAACEMENRFICRGFSWLEGPKPEIGARGICDLHSEDLVTTGSWLLRRTGAAVYYRRVICLNITVDCEGSNMIVTYRPRGLFRGRMYVPGHGEQCSARLNGDMVQLSLPVYGDCDVNFAHGISSGPNGVINRTMAYVMLMIQNNPIIQTAGDRWVRVGCAPGLRTTHVDALVTVKDAGKPSAGSQTLSGGIPAAASAVYGGGAAPLSMYVVRTDGEDERGASDAVSLGEVLELRVETTDDNEIEAYHLVASSRLGDSSVLLLDSKGCPTGQVDFPSFTRSQLGGVQRLSARFKAFRFPTSHIVRFVLIIRYCDRKCKPVKCGGGQQSRSSRQVNDTSYEWTQEGVRAAVREDTWEHIDDIQKGGVVAQGGAVNCGTEEGKVPLELEMVVGSRDILSADTLIRADHQFNLAEGPKVADGGLVCVHELLLVALALTWLAIQVILLLGCCVLVKRYRSLAEMNMQKEYQSFDNLGFDTISTHRRVHWPDQNIDILHAT